MGALITRGASCSPMYYRSPVCISQRARTTFKTQHAGRFTEHLTVAAMWAVSLPPSGCWAAIAVVGYGLVASKAPRRWQQVSRAQSHFLHQLLGQNEVRDPILEFWASLGAAWACQGHAV